MLEHEFAGVESPTEQPPAPLLQVLAPQTSFSACNYSLYPARRAYPWSSAYAIVRGSRYFSVELCRRAQTYGDDGLAERRQQVATQIHEGLDANALAAVLWRFIEDAPVAAQARVNLNLGERPRVVTGRLHLLGYRLAAVDSGGRLIAGAGVRFDPQPGVTIDTGADGSARPRHQIVIAPGLRVEFALPLRLAQAAQQRGAGEFRVETLEALPLVFAERAAFRALWPDAVAQAGSERFRIEAFDSGDAGCVFLRMPPAVQRSAASYSMPSFLMR